MSKEFAHDELKRAGLFDEDSDYAGGLGKAVAELVEVFDRQGHSGASAHMTVDLFSKVALHQPLTSLTGEDDEWFEHDHGSFQNTRCSAVFKEGKYGRAYYLDAISWRSQRGSTFSQGKSDDGITGPAVH